MLSSNSEMMPTRYRRADTSDLDISEPASKSFYQVGGIAALSAVLFALMQMGIETVGVFTLGSPPNTTVGWFTLLQMNRIVGLTELTALQIPLFALLVPVFLAIYIVQRRDHPTTMTVATALALVGIAIYLSSNTALAMSLLSDRYAAATTDAERTMFVAAGEALFATYQGMGIDVGLLLVCLSVLISSWVMLRSNVFSRMTALLGILSGAAELAYYPILLLSPNGIFVLELSGVLLVGWLALIARRLLQGK